VAGWAGALLVVPLFPYDPLVSDSSGSESGQGFDPTIPNVARVYDFMLGGKTNFAADRQLAEQLLAAFPVSTSIARQNRAFLGRAVRFCAEQGIDQFLDMGSGLPTMDNVHEVARRVTPGASVVYVDNDRVALAHARALLATSPGVSAIWGDLREPGKILAEVEARGLIDLSRPLVVLLAAILHFVADDEDPAQIVQVLRDAMPAGSYLVLSHASHDARPEDSAVARSMYRGASSLLATRTYADIAAFFNGLELVDPGVVLTSKWRPQEQAGPAEPGDLYAGVGRKP
jgi:SAM-dependent methyltransferase